MPNGTENVIFANFWSLEGRFSGFSKISLFEGSDGDFGAPGPNRESGVDSGQIRDLRGSTREVGQVPDFEVPGGPRGHPGPGRGPGPGSGLGRVGDGPGRGGKFPPYRPLFNSSSAP